jgi:hypothetical protein
MIPPTASSGAFDLERDQGDIVLGTLVTRPGFDAAQYPPNGVT